MEPVSTSHDVLLRQILDQDVTAEEILSVFTKFDILTEGDLETLLRPARKN